MQLFCYLYVWAKQEFKYSSTNRLGIQDMNHTKVKIPKFWNQRNHHLNSKSDF